MVIVRMTYDKYESVQLELSAQTSLQASLHLLVFSDKPPLFQITKSYMVVVCKRGHPTRASTTTFTVLALLSS